MSIKEDFLKYIGDGDSLAGYSRSYKIVFLISFLELAADTGSAKVIDVARSFKKFYELRKNKGLLPDLDVEPRIQNIDQSTIAQILAVIKDNPYKVISQRGFIDIQINNGEELFCFNKDLFNELTSDDKYNLMNTLKNKLELYFNRIDRGVNILENDTSLRKYFDEVMKNYVEARTSEPFANHPLGKVIRNEIPNIIKQSNFIDESIYKAKGSCGMGSWTYTPWIAISDNRITNSIEHGVYITYLFSSDMEKVYLTLNQGCTRLKKQYGSKEAILKMQELANQIRGKLRTDGDFLTDNDLNIGHELYEKGCIFYKTYEKGHVPDDEQLITDLEKMMRIYQQYYESFIDNSSQDKYEENEMSDLTDLVTEFDVKDEANRIALYIKSKGFIYQDDLIMNFYLALKSKPFVILAGTSGTGKSKLVKLFAEAIGATSENGRYKLIAVKPDWSDSTDLLGYRDLNGKFHAGVLTNVILRAKRTPEEPYFICLDEMNLARVEYYLSDILSIMESRKWKDEEIITDRLITEECIGSNEMEKELYKDLYIPDNLYIIGTVNMDETTFPFSKKVLDRANTIEFSYVDLDITQDKVDEQLAVALHNSFLRSDYLLLEDCMNYEEKLNETISILKEINEVLFKSNLHFGYRIRDEICFYITYNHVYDLIRFNQAMDNGVLQKILPRIQGSSMSIKRLLIDIFKICINDSSQLFSYENAGVNEEMFKYLTDTKKIPYRKSAEKVAFMMRRFEEDGFTSYWL